MLRANGCFPCFEIWIIDASWGTKGAFVLGENDFLKSFFPKPTCLAAVNVIFQKIASYWLKFSPLTQKWFYTPIFTSNHFRGYAKHTESEREKAKHNIERARARKPRSKREREREPRSESTDRRSRRQAARSTIAIDEIARCDRAARSWSMRSRGAISRRAVRSTIEIDTRARRTRTAQHRESES